MSKRIWSQRKILKSPVFLKTVKEVISALDHAEIRYALIGGLAVAYHANPPVTIDADFLIDTDNMDVVEVLFRGGGWEAYPLVFRHTQRGLPRYGWAVRKRGRTPIDLVSTSGDGYLSEVVKEAVPVKLGGVSVPMVSAEDLIVMKTLVGRDKDIEDTIAIRQAADVDEYTIKKTLAKLLMG